MKMSAKKPVMISIGVVIGVIVAGCALVLFKTSEAQNGISKQILAEVNFTIFYPENTTKATTGWQLKEDRTSYDRQSGVLTLYAGQSSTSREVVLNEQATPGAFEDVPTQYSKMLTTLNEYNELQIAFGTVALTRPKELNGGQAAVVNKSGTLMFAKPSENMKDDEWRSFFESLRILR